MGVIGICPACGDSRPLAEYLAETRSRQALGAALRIDPRIADALLDYLALWAPPGKRLQERKLARLLVEIQGLMEPRSVTRDRQTWPAPLEYWREAMETMAASPTLQRPVKSHGYLLEVVTTMARRAAAGQEQAQIERHRQPYRDLTPMPVEPAPAPKAEPPKRTPPPKALFSAARGK